jgi:CBS-domain-containing membrane protein
MLIIRDCMKKTVFSIAWTATIRDAAKILVDRHVGILPVLDKNNHPIGVAALKDLVNLTLPSFVHLFSDVDFVSDFGAVEDSLPSEANLDKSITTLMHPGTVLEETSGLLRAYAFMLQHDLHDLPVVDQEGKLSGIVSRVDLGTAILENWQLK